MFPGFTCPCTSGKCRTAVRQKFSDADMSKKNGMEIFLKHKVKTAYRRNGKSKNNFHLSYRRPIHQD